MFRLLWVVFQAFQAFQAVAAEAGVFSAQLAGLAANNNGAAAAAAGTGPDPGIQTNAGPVQLGGSFSVTPASRFPPIPGGTAGGNLDLQRRPAQGAAGGVVSLFTILPQGRDPLGAPPDPHQARLFPATTPIDQRPPGAPVRPPTAALRLRRSAAAPVRRRRSPELLTTEEEEEEDEDCSGMDTDEDTAE